MVYRTRASLASLCQESLLFLFFLKHSGKSGTRNFDHIAGSNIEWAVKPKSARFTAQSQQSHLFLEKDSAKIGPRIGPPYLTIGLVTRMRLVWRI